MVNLKGRLRCVGVTDTGRVREHNEDTIGTDPGIGLIVLADGMGGYKAGEVASGITVRTVLSLLKAALEREDLGIRDEQSGLSRPGILLRDAIQRANKLIYQTAKVQANCEGMGTTVVAGIFHDNHLTLAHVGDSRAYRMRDGQLEQLTQDHSLLQELVSRGFYTQEEAERAASRNYVTRALGVEPTVASQRLTVFVNRRLAFHRNCLLGPSAGQAGSRGRIVRWRFGGLIA